MNIFLFFIYADGFGKYSIMDACKIGMEVISKPCRKGDGPSVAMSRRLSISKVPTVYYRIPLRIRTHYQDFQRSGATAYKITSNL